MKISSMPAVLAPVIVGAVIVLGGGYALGSKSHNGTQAKLMSSDNQASQLQTQNAVLQSDANSFNGQLTEAQAKNTSLQKELNDRPTVQVPAPGTVRDLDSDGD
jgi:peptidoglycan hydrolase CwlO-like protein